MNLIQILSILVISGGVFFLLVGSIGLIRLPDFFSRSHATGKADTLGILLVIFGLIIYEGLTLNSAKMLLILVFVAFTSPTATHALARAAYLIGVKPRFVKGPEKKEK
ncbi:monovalent cation/H(+) antiporter subunit G [Acidobacteriota bacterium]